MSFMIAASWIGAQNPIATAWYIGPSSRNTTSSSCLLFCACSLASVSVELPGT